MEFLKALQEDTGNNFSYLVLMNSQNLPVVEGDTISRGKVHPHPLPQSSLCFHFYVMIKGMRKAWLSEVSESPSRRYGKQFLRSRSYEQSQYLPAVEGDNLSRGKVSPTPLNPHVCFHFYVTIKVIEKSLVS